MTFFLGGVVCLRHEVWACKEWSSQRLAGFWERNMGIEQLPFQTERFNSTLVGCIVDYTAVLEAGLAIDTGDGMEILERS